MTDLNKTIIPKSDQLNSDDLIGGPRTIKITKVSLLGEAAQPIGINYEGDNGKPYKPCKSMRRVMVKAWGGDGHSYIGHQMTLYRDDKVTFGGMAVGGIRISHMSHIEGVLEMALTATRSSRQAFTVRPLATAESKADQLRNKLFEEAAKGPVALTEYWNKLTPALQKAAENYKIDLDNTAAAKKDDFFSE